MIKLYYREAVAALLGLFWLDRYSKKDLNAVVQEISDATRGGRQLVMVPAKTDDDRIGVAVGNTLYNGSWDTTVLWQEILKPLAKQIGRNRQGRGDEDEARLVNIIARHIQRPFAGMIGRESLDALKEAILIPEETSKLEESLNKGECFCCHCNRAIVSGEMMSVAPRDHNHDTRIYCFQCVQPSYVPCATYGCNGKIEIKPSEQFSNLFATICDECRGKKTKKKVPNSATIHPSFIGAIEEVQDLNPFRWEER